MHKNVPTTRTKGELQFPISEPALVNTELSIRMPSEAVRSMILFFRPPYPHYSHIQSASSQEQFLEQQKDFRERVANLTKGTYIDSPLLNNDEVEQVKSNIQTALRFVEKGYARKDKRRTGEPYDYHVDRIFLRGVKSLHLATSKKEIDSISTALLARIFHDEAENDDKERNKEFAITPPSPRDAMNVCHIYTKELKGSFDLHLSKKSRDLLLLEIGALTLPQSIERKTRNGEATEEQITHLLATAETIVDQYSPLDAYLTLRAKIDDRIDNIVTYFEGHDTNKANTKDGLLKKIGETINYFKAVEDAASRHLERYIDQDPELNSKLAHDFVKNDISVVDLCQTLLTTKGFDQLFQKQIETTQAGYTDADLGIFEHFLIPSHKPQIPYSVN